MIRAVPHALSRPAGFAMMKPAEKPQLDPARILTMSGTIAVNLLAFGLLMMPLSMPAPAVIVDQDSPKDPDVVLIPKQKPLEVPVVPPPPVVPVIRQQPQQHGIVPAPAMIDAPVPSDTGSELAVDAADPGPVIDLAPASAGPAPMQLQYVHAPAPAYPRNSIRLNHTGTVLLQVLVGVDGRPIEVTVARTSGHGELDRAAREQVLKQWSFRPATRNGQPVQAIGMVPVEFKLR